MTPLTLIPQHFGALVFDHRSSRYVPFDRAAADVLRDLTSRPAHAVLAGTPDALGLIEHFDDHGWFTPSMRLAADVLDLDRPTPTSPARSPSTSRSPARAT